MSTCYRSLVRHRRSQPAEMRLVLRHSRDVRVHTICIAVMNLSFNGRPHRPRLSENVQQLPTVAGAGGQLVHSHEGGCG